MGYKYRQGSTPDEVDSSMSNPTMPHTGVKLTSGPSTATRGDTTFVRRDGYPATSSNPGRDKGVFPDSSSVAKDKTNAAVKFIRGGGDGKGGEFSDADYGKAKSMMDSAHATDANNKRNAADRDMVSGLLKGATQKSDNTRVKK